MKKSTTKAAIILSSFNDRLLSQYDVIQYDTIRKHLVCTRKTNREPA